MNKIKRILIEKDILDKPKYLKTFESNGFVYGLQIHFQGRMITKDGRMVGLSNPYITLTKYEIKTYIDLLDKKEIKEIYKMYGVKK